MLYSNKMIYQAPKYHSNSFSHFLQLHSSNNNNNNNDSMPPSRDSPNDENTKLDINNDSNSNTSTTSLEVVNENAGKSFTIAAILGLNKSTMRHEDASGNLSDYNSDFPSLINLTAHSKLFQKFDNENRHGFMTQQQISASSEHHPQMPVDPSCMYDNNNASNSSYQDHLQNKSEFPNNFTRNNDETNNQVIRNHMHQHAANNNNNLLNKAFNRERNRLETFTNRKSSISLKNKRVRTIFTPEQLERLEAEFERQQYMVGPERLYLAHTLQLTEAQVKVWFQNRRIKWRKHHLEITQQHLAIARQRQIPVAVPSTSRNLSSEESRQSADDHGGVSDDGDD